MTSIRRSQKLQRYFEGTGFSVTKVLFEGTPHSMEPIVYLDEQARRWAVRLPGSGPRIFSYDDVLACEIAEVQPTAQEDASGGQRLWDLLVDLSRASQANAAKKGYCLGMGVVAAVCAPEIEGGVAHLQLPLLTRETKRALSLYQRMLQNGGKIKTTFDAMNNQVTKHE